jgi:phenol 2-monooxygenase
MRDLHKVFLDDAHYNHGHGRAYRAYGVDPALGAVVVVRPDQYVAQVVRLEKVGEVERFFEGCLLEPRDSRLGAGGKGEAVAKL